MFINDNTLLAACRNILLDLGDENNIESGRNCLVPEKHKSKKDFFRNYLENQEIENNNQVKDEKQYVLGCRTNL